MKNKPLNKRDLSISTILYRIFTFLGIALTILVIVSIIGYILITGIPNLSADIFAWEYNSDNGSMMPAIINTVIVVLLSLIVAVPLGVGSAVYLCEYAKTGNPLVKVVRLTTETLSGIPSIVYGLFGSLFFVRFCGFGLSIISGALTLAIMILPIIMRTTEEALLMVPIGYKEGSYGLGAGKLRTVSKIIIPSAMPGILSGILLGTGRIVGETVALLFTAGSVAAIAADITKSGRTLSVHMYALSNEGLHIPKAQATAVVLLVIVVLLNGLSAVVAGKLTKSKDKESK
ncbi:MAG: phosphate ABC transporter permease PstA [Christensenellaceae bacterium]|nr:phosphate ABC transporter permease PstA [Christensenellaceae bacterium]